MTRIKNNITNKLAIWLASMGFIFATSFDTGTLKANAEIYSSESRKIA